MHVGFPCKWNLDSLLSTNSFPDLTSQLGSPGKLQKTVM